MAIKDYSTTPDMNTTISGINIAEGCAPSGINNAIRQLMADLKEEQEARAAEQAAKDEEQDAKIAEAKSSAAASSEEVTALDAAVVHKTGNETIAGRKSFSGDLQLKNATPNFAVIHSDVTKGQLPASTQFATVSILADAEAFASAQRLLSVTSQIDSDGTSHAKLITFQFVKSSTANAFLDVAYPLEGDPYATAPTPAINSNTNHIATTEWVRARTKWHYRRRTLTTDSSIGKRMLDFADYLPADGEEYEVLMRIQISRSDTSGTNTEASIYLEENLEFVSIQADGSNFQQTNDSFICPISASRQLAYEIKGYSPAVFNIFAFGYRKA